MLKNKIIAITGVTGAVGSVLVKGLLKTDAKKIVCISKNKERQEFFKGGIDKNFLNKLDFKLLDITNKNELENALQKVDITIHCAAIAHGEQINNESLLTSVNVDGTKNIVDACIKNKVEKLLFVSTSMACNPLNLYGKTKKQAEEIVLKANECLNASVLRLGNVCSSSNGVIKLFLNKIKEGIQNLPVTDEKMTRFWVDDYTIIKSVKFCLKHAKGGEIFAYKSPSFKIVDLVKAITNKPYVVVGLRENEKLTDEIFDKKHTIYTNGEYFVEWQNDSNYSNINKTFYKTKEVYTSLENKFLSVEEIKQKIEQLKDK